MAALSLSCKADAYVRFPPIADITHVFVALIASVAVYDLMACRRVHLATIIGAAVLLALGLTQEAIGDTAVWLDTAHHLLKV